MRARNSRRFKALFFIAATAVIVVMAGRQAIAASDIERDFAAIQRDYFKMLDFQANASHRAEIPAFAARLSDVADKVIGGIERNERNNGTIRVAQAIQPEKAGLVLIYDGLLTLNNMHAAMDGLQGFASIGERGTSKRDELLARARRAVSEFELAKELRPFDRRIDSWTMSGRATLELIEKGKVSEKTWTRVLDAVIVRPTFNLWTAFLLFRAEDASTSFFGQLAGLARVFVDNTRADKDPCKQRPEDCQSGALAPTNWPASITLLGDAFLRRANYLMSKGDIAEAMLFANYAQGTYGMLNAGERQNILNSWPDRDALPARLSLTQRLLKTRQPFDDAEFVASPDYRRPYECSACHGRVEKQK